MYTEYCISYSRITDEESSILSSIIESRISDRCCAKPEGNNNIIHLVVSTGFSSEGYRIDDAENGLTISSGSFKGILYGVGRFLHESQYTTEGFIPLSFRGTSDPDSSFRGVYFANHFHNWYHISSEEKLQKYIEDIALWGINSLILVFPIINLENLENEEAMTSIENINILSRNAKRVGMKVGIGIVPNQDFRFPRTEFLAEPNVDQYGRRGNNGNNLCISKPGCIDYLKELHTRVGDKLKTASIDYIVSWPYDEGGCGCSECSPWGANGFIRITKVMMEAIRSSLPEAELIMSTWAFDTPYQGEWDGFAREISVDSDWISYIVSDSHTNYPEYPLNNPVPGNKPLLNYPEISMWGLFPWGGFGANPLPKRLEILWNQVKQVVDGGYPYSEGIYDDINKVIVSGFYWDKNTSSEKTLRNYINYEFGHSVTKEVLELISLIEKNHTLFAEKQEIDFAAFNTALALAHQIDDMMSSPAKSSWRWRILFLRAVLDNERYSRFLEGDIEGSPNEIWIKAVNGNDTAKAALEELLHIYGFEDVDHSTDPYHLWVRPPVC